MPTPSAAATVLMPIRMGSFRSSSSVMFLVAVTRAVLRLLIRLFLSSCMCRHVTSSYFTNRLRTCYDRVMRGTVYRQCWCRGPDGKKLHGRCPQLGKRGHGKWYYRYEAP